MKSNTKSAGLILDGALSLTVSTIIIKIIGVLYKIPLSYILGDEGMGYFNSAYTVYGFFYIICNSGIPKIVTIEVAKYVGSDKRNIIPELAKKLLSIFGIFGTAITLIIIIFSKPLTLLIGNPRSEYTLLAIIPTLAFITLGGIIRGVLNGISKLLPIAISQVIEAASKLLLGLLFAYIGAKLLLPLPIISALTVLGITLGSVFSLIYLYIAYKFKEREFKEEQTSQIDVKHLIRNIIKKSLPITASATVLAMSNMIDLTLVMRGLISSGISDTEATAIYGNYTTLSIPMLNLVSSLLIPITAALLPKLVVAYQSRENEEYNKLLNTALFLTTALAAPMALMFFLYPFDILDLLFPTYASASGSSALMLLSPSMLLLPLLNVINTALESMGRIRDTLISLLIGTAFKITFSALLIGRIEIGILAVSAGTTLSYLISLIISISFLKRTKSAKIRFIDIAKPIIEAVISYTCVFILIYLTGCITNTFASFFASAAASTLLYFCVQLKRFIIHFNASNKNRMHKKESIG